MCCSIALHSWIAGQPHRIAAIDRVLTDLPRRPGVWPATAAQVVATFTAQQEQTAMSLRVGIVGAGLWTERAHLPAFTHHARR